MITFFESHALSAHLSAGLHIINYLTGSKRLGTEEKFRTNVMESLIIGCKNKPYLKCIKSVNEEICFYYLDNFRTTSMV